MRVATFTFQFCSASERDSRQFVYESYLNDRQQALVEAVSKNLSVSMIADEIRQLPNVQGIYADELPSRLAQDLLALEKAGIVRRDAVRIEHTSDPMFWLRHTVAVPAKRVAFDEETSADWMFITPVEPVGPHAYDQEPEAAHLSNSEVEDLIRRLTPKTQSDPIQ